MTWKNQVIRDIKTAGSHIPDSELRRVVVDEYNHWKLWHIIRTKSRHYALVQTVKGQVTGCIKQCGLKQIEFITGHRYVPPYWRNQNEKIYWNYG